MNNVCESWNWNQIGNEVRISYAAHYLIADCFPYTVQIHRGEQYRPACYRRRVLKSVKHTGTDAYPFETINVDGKKCSAVEISSDAPVLDAT